METNYSYSNISNIDISFYINEKSQCFETYDDKLSIDNNNNKCLKEIFPKNKIFRINSIIYNTEKNIKEIYTQYDCIYNKKNNSLYLILNSNHNYAQFTKDRLINILEFSLYEEINTIYLLVDKKNKYYLNIIQDMILVGFEPEDKIAKKIVIDGNVYKTLKMSISDISKEIEEIELI